MQRRTTIATRHSAQFRGVHEKSWRRNQLKHGCQRSETTAVAAAWQANGSVQRLLLAKTATYFLRSAPAAVDVASTKCMNAE